MTRFLILALLLCAMPAHAGDYWFHDRVAATDVMVIYLPEITCRENEPALGCYREWYGHGVIQVKAGLPPAVAECVLNHERHHADGYDHPSLALSFIDCGNGTWLSQETLARLL
jgi:hypothetical protein